MTVDQELEAMINDASAWAEEFFAEHGGLNPQWHAISKAGRHVVMPVPEELSKDEAAMIARLLFEAHGAQRCLFISEAWNVEAQGDKAIAELHAWLDSHDNSLEGFPGCIEVVAFAAEDKSGRTIAARRVIDRSGVKPVLGPLEIDRDIELSDGRFVGMLSPEGKAN